MKKPTKKVLDRPKADALATTPQFDPAGEVTPFGRRGTNSVAGLKVKSMSPIIDPKKWPKDEDGNDQELFGRFTKLFHTRDFERDGNKKGAPKQKIIGTGMEIWPDGAPGGVALPLTAVLRQALQVTGDGADARSPYLGMNVLILLDSKNPLPSKQGNAAHNFKVAVDENSALQPA